MSPIENTSKRDPMVHALGAMMEGTPASYITAMESAGQDQLVNSDLLPAQGDWVGAAKLGVVKGERVVGDELFVHVTLPTGWTRQGSSHAMHSYICDERGVKRIVVFYKAAFYDRRADFNMVGVGHALASEIIYDDSDVALPDVWPVLTLDEKAEFGRELQEYLARAVGYPEVYGGNLNRVNRLIKLLQRS